MQAAYTRVRFGANRQSITNNFYSLKDRLIDGTDVTMDQFKGDVLVIVNVASK